MMKIHNISFCGLFLNLVKTQMTNLWYGVSNYLGFRSWDSQFFLFLSAKCKRNPPSFVFILGIWPLWPLMRWTFETTMEVHGFPKVGVWEACSFCRAIRFWCIILYGLVRKNILTILMFILLYCTTCDHMSQIVWYFADTDLAKLTISNVLPTMHPS